MADDSREHSEICDFNGTAVTLPVDLIESAEIFSKIVSFDTWNNVLSSEDRKHLEKFLPKLPTDYPHAQDDNLRALFDGENFKFGNPVQDFQSKLKDGYFYPDVVKYKKLCQKAKKKEYKLQLQVYYRKLLQEVIVSRQEILDQVSRQGPNDPIHTRGKVVSENGQPIGQRVHTRFQKIIQECKQESEDQGISSDDEDKMVPGHFGAIGFPISGFHGPPGLFNPPGYHGLIPPIPGMPYGFPSSFSFPSQSSRQPLGPSNTTVTERDFQQMLQKHKKRRLQNEDHPELDTRFMALTDVVFRTNPSKRGAKTFSSRTNVEQIPQPVEQVSKKKDKKAKLKRKIKQRLQQKQARKQDKSSSDAHSSLPPPPSGKFSSFFSLLREVFYSMPDYKASLHKIEEIIKSWQSSPSYPLNIWSQQQADWVKLVYSSLIYISGSSGVTQSSFVPLVDFKERPQQWKWIGAFRDSDEELAMLCQDWLQVKDQLSIKKATAEGGSTVNAPEARVKTDYVVRPSTCSERDIFRDQEKKRYMNPHKAYSYCMHGFESVVGPVKGVFSKETNLNKAREHSLLISNRPPFVTILTLVRDAAARLPNGEGTRAEVCELLKDSQFLNPDATEAQIHTVVSGALDRLHYEKDPCVKYDSNRKVWIYLHRNRTEEEFEKIHQANAAAARAKKLQKPRMPRNLKTKDESTTSVSETVDPSAAKAVPSPPNQPAPAKPVEVKKPAIRLKIAAGTISDHPKVSVITSLPVNSKLTQPTNTEVGEQIDVLTTKQEEPTDISQLPTQVSGRSKLNSSNTSAKSTTGIPSPGPRYTSALNTHTSALNSANVSATGTGSETVMSGSRDASGSEGSGSNSNSDSESSTGNESSSDEEEEESAEEATGGKTKHGLKPYAHEDSSHLMIPTTDSDRSQFLAPDEDSHQSLGYTSHGESASKDGNESEEESAASEGTGSESEDSNED